MVDGAGGAHVAVAWAVVAGTCCVVAGTGSMLAVVARAVVDGAGSALAVVARTVVGGG